MTQVEGAESEELVKFREQWRRELMRQPLESAFNEAKLESDSQRSVNKDYSEACYETTQFCTIVI